jgi:hypothetical protein
MKGIVLCILHQQEGYTMSASIISLGFNARSTSGALELPDIGGVRRGIAAFVAVAMLIVGVAGWSRSDLPAGGAAPAVTAGF